MTPPPGLPRPTPSSQPRYLALPAVKPRLTYGLLAINVLVFAAQTLTGPSLWFFFGEKNNALIVAGEWWRLVTPMFLHANWFHVGVNSYSLFIIGPQVEALLGYRRFLIVYLLAGVSGTVVSFVLSPYRSVGASGAILGLVGVMLVYFYRHRQLFGEMGRRRLIDILVIAGINLVIGLIPGIDMWGHVGGLAGGAVLAWLLGPIYAVQPDPATAQPRVVDTSPLNGQRWLGVLAVLLALVAITLVAANAKR